MNPLGMEDDNITTSDSRIHGK